MRSNVVERIAEAVGYEGSDKDGLVDAVEELVDAVEKMAAGGAITMPSTVDLAKALGLPDTAPWQVVELAALQTAALLEDAADALLEDTADELRDLRMLLNIQNGPVSMVEHVKHLVAACAAADAVDNELAIADRRIEKLEAQFDRIRAALGGDDPIPVANLAGEVEKLAAAYRNGKAYIEKIDTAIGWALVPLNGIH